MNNKIIKYLTIATLVTSLSWVYIEKTQKNNYKSLYEEKIIENLDLKIKNSYLVNENSYLIKDNIDLMNKNSYLINENIDLMNENIREKINNCYLKLNITKLEIKEELNKTKSRINEKFLYHESLLEKKMNNEKDYYILLIDSINRSKNY